MASSKPSPGNDATSTKGKATKGMSSKDGVQKPKRVPRGSKRDWSQYSHNLPGRTELAKNGRNTGRNLIAWTRPRMAEKLLLHIEYECLLHNRPVPWDAVAHRFNPGSSGDAITQRLVRLRKELIAEGHMVPPYPQKPGGPVEDVAVRGIIRANPDRVDDGYTTRKVLWTEPIDDLKKPLGNAVYALQGHKDNESSDHENVFDEDEDVNGVDKRDFSRVRASGSGAVQSLKGKGLARPARPVRSVAKNMSYTEDEDDVFDEGSDIARDDIENVKDDEDGDDEFGVRNGSQTSSRTSRMQRTSRSQSRGPGGHGRGLNAGIQPPYAPHPFTAATPGGRALSTNHMSPYGMTPNGVNWMHGPMGLPMMPMGMGLDMMGGFNTTPHRSSAFTTQATSPAEFDIEGASPRSTAYFQAHLNEYNSPTPRGHAGFTPMMPIPMGLASYDTSMMPGGTLSGASMMPAGILPDNSMMLHNQPTQVKPMGDVNDNGHDNDNDNDNDDLPLETSDVEFVSMFSDAETVAKRL